MTTDSYKTAIDAFTDHNNPTGNQGDWLRMYIRAEATAQGKYVYLYFPRPAWGTAPRVTSALLHFFLGDNGSSCLWAGQTSTVTARRITAAWSENGITWNAAPAVDVTAVRPTVVVPPSAARNDHIVLDVTTLLSEAAAGSLFYGIRLTVSTDVGGMSIWSSEYTDPSLTPYLEVTWGGPPAAPYDLVPAGTLAVGTPTPTLGWQYQDGTGASSQLKYQAQVATDSAFAGIVYDTGLVASNVTQAAMTFALTAGVTYWWRVRVTDNNGTLSAYSDTAVFVYRPKGTLAFTGPTAGLQTSTNAAPTSLVDSAPPVQVTFTPPAGATIDQVSVFVQEAIPDVFGNPGTAYRDVIVTAPVHTVVNPYTFTIPVGTVVRKNWPYRIVFRVWDSFTRIGTPGDTPYVESSNAGASNGYFKFIGDPAVAYCTAVVLTPRNDPGIEITWTYVGTPTAFLIEVDSKVLVDNLDPAAVLVSGNNYKYTTFALIPGYVHSVSPHAVTTPGGVRTVSSFETAATITPAPAGVWFIRKSNGDKIVVDETGVQDQRMSLGETATIYNPVGRRDPVKLVDSVRGYEGVTSGLLVSKGIVQGQDMSAIAQKDRLVSWRGVTNEDFLLVWGTYAFTVRFGAIEVYPDSRTKGKTFRVGIEFFQVADYTFTVS